MRMTLGEQPEFNYKWCKYGVEVRDKTGKVLVIAKDFKSAEMYIKAIIFNNFKEKLQCV